MILLNTIESSTNIFSIRINTFINDLLIYFRIFFITFNLVLKIYEIGLINKIMFNRHLYEKLESGYFQ